MAGICVGRENTCGDGTWSAAVLGTGSLRVAAVEQVVVPGREGVRRDDQAELTELFSGEAVE